MIRLLFFSLSLLSSSVFSATCLQPLSFYGCTNATGTSCSKVAVSAFVASATAPNNAACASVALSPAEYVSTLNNTADISSHTNSINSLNSGLNTTNSNVSALSSALSTLQTAYNGTVTRVNDLSTLITQTAGSVSSLTSQLNVPFDLQTALAATAFFFSTVLFFYGVAKTAGIILSGIKNPLRRGSVN
jgi:hypothetical protein